MATISFKSKIQEMYNIDGSVAYQYIPVPVLDRKHCDMPAFRSHPKFGAYANSDLFKGMLARARKDIFGNGWLRLDAVPDGVWVDTGGFLAVVSFEL